MKIPSARYLKCSRSLLAAICLLLALLVPARQAWARSYSVSQVDIDAVVETDGSLEVVERRSYVFRGDFNGIFWDVPCGEFEGRTVNARIDRVCASTDGATVEFKPGADGNPETFEMSEEQDCLRLKLYYPASDQTVTFEVTYALSGVATRWADTAELYWQYVPADLQADVKWENIGANIALPVPEGERIDLGENVRAWGHGPLDGVVSSSADGVRLFSPGVGTAEFLEARIVFPESWLSEAQPSDEARLEDIMAEEDQWARDANARRRKARLLTYGFPGMMVLLSAMSLAAMKWYQIRGKLKMPKAQFSEKYCRDVPTNDHPAVLGMLYREGRPEGKDFAATLMRLTDQRRISLDSVEHNVKTKRGGTKSKREWRLLLHEQMRGRGAVRQSGRAIDDAAFDFLHDVIADKHKHDIDPSLLGPAGEPYVLMSFFNEVAQTWPKAYEQGYARWSDAVKGAYESRGFETSDADSGLMPGILGLGDFVLAVVLGIAGILLEVPNLTLCIGVIACFGAGIAIILLDDEAPSIIFSQEAVEIKAQLEALRRWLVDFTRLEEAVPADVTLWNRLLVMATELDVADKVIEQLRVAMPQVVGDPAFSAWCASELQDPREAFRRSVDKGADTSSSKLYHEVSTESLAESHDSSPSGGGGGFSSGGGGGFSGGGRGGAF
jgi:uncharacterized membrane protein